MAFRQCKIADGLPGNSIRSVVHDKMGYAWIATANALSRFDGVSFTNAEVLDTSFRLGSSSLFRLVSMDDSLMALTTDKAVCPINTKQFRSGRYEFNSEGRLLYRKEHPSSSVNNFLYRFKRNTCNHLF